MIEKIMEGALLSYGHAGFWGIVGSLVLILLTLSWTLGSSRGVRHATGRLGGPATLGLLAYWASHKAMELVFANKWWLALAALVLLLVPSLGHLVWSLLVQAWETLSRWILQPLLNGLGPLHMVAGGLFVSWVINNPWLNQTLYYVPSILTVMLGLYTLIFRKPWNFVRETDKENVQRYAELSYGRRFRVEDDYQREVVTEAISELRGETEAQFEARILEEAQRAVDERRQLKERRIREAELRASIEEVDTLLNGSAEEQYAELEGIIARRLLAEKGEWATDESEAEAEESEVKKAK